MLSHQLEPYMLDKLDEDFALSFRCYTISHIHVCCCMKKWLLYNVINREIIMNCNGLTRELFVNEIENYTTTGIL